MFKRISIFVFTLIFPLIYFASPPIQATFVCKARYSYKIWHPPVEPASYNGSIIGSGTIAGTGQDGYYETKWSKTYTLEILFLTGYEINEMLGYYKETENKIFAYIEWSDGGSSLIKVNNFVSGTQTVEKENFLNAGEGKVVKKMTGYDLENYYWEIYF